MLDIPYAYGLHFLCAALGNIDFFPVCQRLPEDPVRRSFLRHADKKEDALRLKIPGGGKDLSLNIHAGGPHIVRRQAAQPLPYLTAELLFGLPDLFLLFCHSFFSHHSVFS